MVTDLVQIGRLTASHAAENLAFQRQLEAHHYPAEPFQVLCEQIEEQIDCKSCANCCRQTRVGVSPGEIARIADYLGITPDDVVRQYTAVDPDNHSARLLAHTKTGCVFLDGNLCIVYEARPLACREFPHLDTGHRSLGSRLPSVFKRASFCPIVFNVLERYKKLTGFRYDSLRCSGNTA